MIQKPTSTSITGKRAAPGRALAVNWTSYFGMADTSGRRSASSRPPEPVGQCEPLGRTARLPKILRLKGGRSFQPAAFLFSLLRECVAAVASSARSNTTTQPDGQLESLIQILRYSIT